MKRMMLLILTMGLALTALAELEIPEGMVLVPGARFAMGVSSLELEQLSELGRDVPHMESHYRDWFSKEQPLHEVIVDSFFLDAQEVSNAEFALFVDETGYEAEGNWREQAGEDREEHPVVSVTWKDAVAYAEWAGCRLPSEAEWEWAARGGGDSRWFPWGDEPDDYESANYGHDRSFWAGLGRLLGFQKIKTEPRATYDANGYGLLDMQGNAAEWCADALLPYPGGTEDVHPFNQEGYFDNPRRVCRGGSWESPNPVYIRSNSRSGRAPESAHWTVGFRCARSLDRQNSVK